MSNSQATPRIPSVPRPRIQDADSDDHLQTGLAQTDEQGIHSDVECGSGVSTERDREWACAVGHCRDDEAGRARGEFGCELKHSPRLSDFHALALLYSYIRTQHSADGDTERPANIRDCARVRARVRADDFADRARDGI